ncbi:MAG TPA: CBS domain-containing protein [archaeon]|nr:CBS domain-containing protein [archaeon]
MIVRDVMVREVVATNPDTSIKKAAEIMMQHHIGSLIVLENEKISGIITETNIMHAVAEEKNPDATAVSDVMSKDVITVEPDKRIEDAVELMLKYKIKKLPVVDDEKLIGVITASDIIVVEPKLIEAVASLVSIKIPGYQGG